MPSASISRNAPPSQPSRGRATALSHHSDEVLKAMAQGLGAAMREADTVGRYGGDEFLILLNDVSQPRAMELIAGKLIAAVSDPLHLDGQALQLSASIGISLFPDNAEDIDMLIREPMRSSTPKRHAPGRWPRWARCRARPAGRPKRRACTTTRSAGADRHQAAASIVPRQAAAPHAQSKILRSSASSTSSR